MRRIVALFGVMLLIIGIRLYNNGLINCGYAGTLSYGTFDTVAYEDAPLLIDGPHRMDLIGDIITASEIMDNLDAKLLWVENVDDIMIIYAYSPRLVKPVVVHGQKVNLMISVSSSHVAAGTPLLYGSY